LIADGTSASTFGSAEPADADVVDVVPPVVEIPEGGVLLALVEELLLLPQPAIATTQASRGKLFHVRI
jgi:hypothetical protein